MSFQLEKFTQTEIYLSFGIRLYTGHMKTTEKFY